MTQGKNKLYLVTNPHPKSKYDYYDSMVVSAPDKYFARKLHPCHSLGWEGRNSSWVELEEVGTLVVETLGKTDKPTGVILASFNAG